MAESQSYIVRGKRKRIKALLIAVGIFATCFAVIGCLIVWLYYSC